MIAAMTLPRNRNLRVGRVSEDGRAYLVTTVTRDRLSLFADLHLARLAIRELRACDEAGLCNTLAFVFMPDHLHWLLQLTSATLPDLLRRYKSRSGGAINRHRGTPGMAVWQAGFHDHALRDGEDLQHIARYIVANPMRAGLAGSVREYSHWDAVWL
jgi:putative transposase